MEAAGTRGHAGPRYLTPGGAADPRPLAAGGASRDGGV